jgi:thiol:disulfide interchange protein DsbD
VGGASDRIDSDDPYRLLDARPDKRELTTFHGAPCRANGRSQSPSSTNAPQLDASLRVATASQRTESDIGFRFSAMASGCEIRLNLYFTGTTAMNFLRTARPSLARRTWSVALALLLLTFQQLALAADDFLEPENAFKLSVQADGQHIAMRFDIAPGYYLYRERLNVQTDPADVPVGDVQIPRGKVKFDQTFQKEVEYFRDQVTMVLPLPAVPTAGFKLVVGNQGCADKGLCYSPMQRAFSVAPVAGASGAAALAVSALAEDSTMATTAPAAVATAPAAVATTPEAGEPGRFASALQSRNLLTVAGVFLLAGLLLSFTPCVLPMIPILSSIIVGQGGKVSKARGFSLALAYSLGMALVYTAFGMAAGLMGEGLAAALQNAWVLGAFALLLVVLSLSMFGAYELQMPSALQNHLTQMSGQMQGGQYAGVFVMGGLSALIVGPCVAAPLAGALVYISQTKDVVLGGAALFSLASGMSVPLLLVGLSAGSLLPRAGGWMERVKHFFGVMLLAVALWLVSPVLPSWGLMLGSAALLLASAVYLGAFERMPEAVTPRRAMTKGVGLLLAILAALQLAGVASGGRSLLEPLQHLSVASSGSQAVMAASGKELKFQSIASLAALDAAVRASTQPVMLDFYADWCVACKEFESLTFTDESVRQRLAGMTLLRADVTANNEQDRALMRKYSLFGPPALLFFAPAGGELSEARVIGFQNAEAFRAHLDRIPASGALRISQN